MKIHLSNYVLILFLMIGCSTSKESTVEKSQAIIHYHIKAQTTEAGVYETLIDNQFKALENLELDFVKIHYNKEDSIQCDCQVDILFDKLVIKDKESINNKSFSKKVRDEQVSPDELGRSGSEVVVGYVHQRKKSRKLKWDIIMNTNSDFNLCKLSNSSFTESLMSKTIDNTLSGDERAISKKYKAPIGELLSKREMAEEAIHKVYKKIEYQLKKNH